MISWRAASSLAAIAVGTIAALLLAPVGTGSRGAAVATAARARVVTPSMPAIAYHPRAYTPGGEDDPDLWRQIPTDLVLLRSVGFRSLVTYGATGALGSIPRVARQSDFDGLIIMGIWDPTSASEMSVAVKESRFVDGYCVGNEGLGVRYEPARLAHAMSELRRLTGLPVTTSEPIDSYLEGPYRDLLLSQSDWLFPLAHPFWANETDARRAVHWLVARCDYLEAACGRPVVLKEAGMPTAGVPDCDEHVQHAFFELLERSGVPFFHFEAFDQPWKRARRGVPDVEAHWGVFRADGAPKRTAIRLQERGDDRR